MENKRKYLGKKFMLDGKSHTVYAIAPSVVFAHEGDFPVIDENGDISNPRCVEYPYVDENAVPVGRPSIGVTKKVSLTLPEELWEKVDAIKSEQKISQSQLLRTIIENHFENKSADRSARLREHVKGNRNMAISDMSVSELLETYSYYNKLPLRDKEEQEYIGMLRLEMIDRMEKAN